MWSFLWHNHVREVGTHPASLLKVVQTTLWRKQRARCQSQDVTYQWLFRQTALGGPLQKWTNKIPHTLMETVSDSSYTDGLLDLLKCINSQTHAHKHRNTHILEGFLPTSTRSGRAVSNIVRSVRKVPKYGIVPCIAPYKEIHFFEIFETIRSGNKSFKKDDDGDQFTLLSSQVWKKLALNLENKAEHVASSLWRG